MYEQLQKKLGYSFQNEALLRLALSHKSAANEGRNRKITDKEFVSLHNERLEFLGDSVLGLVISDLLCQRFVEVDEGRLSKMRSYLVKEETLARIARELELGSFLLLGKGEEHTQGRNKDSILSSCYEAVLGAIYRDGGYIAVMSVVSEHFGDYVEEAEDTSLIQDTKTQLQEASQAKFKKSPVYQVVAEVGPDHEKIFEVKVSVGELERYGKGRNKKEAEQVAAKFLLDHMRQE